MIDARQTVLFLLPCLEPDGQGAVGRSIALELPQDLFHVAVVELRHSDRQDAAALSLAGIAVESVPIRHMLDLGRARRLRQLAREYRPDIVHAWGSHAARAARCVVSFSDVNGNVPRLVISEASNPIGGIRGWIIRRILRTADRVIPFTRAEGDRYRRLGVPAEQLTLIAPGAPSQEQIHDSQRVCKLDLPPGSQLIVADGRSERDCGPRDAIIAFDMLRYEFQNLHLAILRSGAETASLERFVRSLAFDDCRVHFVPDAEDRRAAIERAEAVVATRPRYGLNDALEGMAMGRPVVGWRTLDLSEIVEDKTTGLLVSPGDHAALAAALRSLLVNPGFAVRMGDAGRARAQERFGQSRMVEQFGRLYRELAPHRCAEQTA